jgi:hypothetical protein
MIVCRVINLQLLGIGAICSGISIAVFGSFRRFSCIDLILIRKFEHRPYLGLIIISTNLNPPSFFPSFKRGVGAFGKPVQMLIDS